MKSFYDFCVLKEQSPITPQVQQQNNMQRVQTTNNQAANNQVKTNQTNNQVANNQVANNQIKTNQINQNQQRNNVDIKQLNNVVAQLKKLLGPIGVKF
jgi:hypothetical protein